MAEAKDLGEIIEASYTFIDHNRSHIPYGKGITDQLAYDYSNRYKLPLRIAVSAFKYLEGLNMTKADYQDKYILDAGSGLGDFKRALKGMGVKAEVVNLDDAKTWGIYNTDVVGKVEALPFADNSFDVAVLNYVFPFVIDETIDPSYAANQLRELIRVTKKGGIIRYRPLRMFDPQVREGSQRVMIEVTKRALEALAEIYQQNPDMKVQITRAIGDDNTYDEILEIVK